MLQQQQQQQCKDTTSTTTTGVTLPPLPASVKSFRAAHRLLLQIYDLDVRHPYCPKDHWLLVSDPSMTKSALLALFNPSKQPAVQPFLDRLRQGDPVPLRILQLMPHTVPFKTRLTVFRDWVALDQANLMTAGSRALRVRRQNVLEDGYRGLGGLPPSGWKGNIRVKFVNELGKLDHFCTTFPTRVAISPFFTGAFIIILLIMRIDKKKKKKKEFDFCL